MTQEGACERHLEDTCCLGKMCKKLFFTVSVMQANGHHFKLPEKVQNIYKDVILHPKYI